MCRASVVWHWLALPLAVMFWLAATPGVATAVVVDLELILAIDCSYSVDNDEFELQKLGLAKAFRNGSVVGLIETGERGVIAVTVIEWSSALSQVVAVPWTLVYDAASANDLATQIAGMPRLTQDGATSIAAMIALGVGLFDSNQFYGARRVIDISADGRNNNGPRIEVVQELAVERRATVNGLAMLHEDKTLDYYFRNKVIAGPDAFVIKANSYDNYVEAILAKLMRELGETPTS